MSEAPRRRTAPIRSISAVLPAYNEAANLSQVVARTIEALDDVVPEFEILVVDDGSRDATRRLAEDLAARHPQVQVIHHAKNRGYGAACRSGISAARKQFVFRMDADGQYNPADLARLVQWNDEFDIVAGYRQRRSDSAFRSLLSFCFKVLIRPVFGVKLRDVNCGFTLYRTSLVKSLSLESASKLINTEIVVRARERQASVREVGIRHFPRRAGKQTGARPGVILGTLREAIAFRRRLNDERKASLQPPPPRQNQQPPTRQDGEPPEENMGSSG